MTSAVVGNSKKPQIAPRWEPYYRLLMDLRQQLGKQKGELVQAASEAYTGLHRDPADVATNTYDRDWALGMASSEQNVLYEIDEALNRIRSGTYGRCELTGKPIPPARLKAMPWTRFTAEAERQLELKGQIDRARLGKRESLNGKNQDDEKG